MLKKVLEEIKVAWVLWFAKDMTTAEIFLSMLVVGLAMMIELIFGMTVIWLLVAKLKSFVM